MAANVSVDAVLADAVSKLDALNKRMDALETGEKNIIKGDDDDDKKRDSAKKADDDDDKRKDSVKKSDAKAKSDDDDDDRKDSAKKSDDFVPKTKILDDDDDDKKDDAFPPKKKDDAFPPKAKKDSKKSDDGELEIKHGKEDSAKKSDAKAKSDDDDDDDRKDSAKKSDDDDDRRDDTRADAISDLRKLVAAQSAEIARLSAVMKPRTDDEHAAFAETQAKADSVFMGFGEHAPRPMEGESLSDYRTRMAVKLKKHSGAWQKVKLWDLPPPAFEIAEKQIYADAMAAAANPVDLEPGELREVVKSDPRTGMKTIMFYGNESFVKGMGRPGRKVTSFRTMSSV